MARRSLDLLPLLDVFVVVLFVFATIQEQKLDSSFRQLEQRDAELERARAQAERLAELELALESSKAQDERAQELAEQVAEYERACGPRGPDDPLCPAASAPDARELAERRELQDRLLDKLAVFEIELSGEADLETGRTHNRCCFRADPPTGQWRRCGELPSNELARQDWFDTGADGLRDALRQTRDGFALVSLRQDQAATHQATSELNSLLRARLPSHRVYDAGVAAGPLGCPAFSGVE